MLRNDRMVSTCRALARYVFGGRFPSAAVLLLAAYATLALTSADQQCATFDEPQYLAGGYSYWTRNDYRLCPYEGHLPQRLAGLALLGGGYSFPATDHEGWLTADAWAVGHDFLYRMGNDARAILRRSRAALLLLSVTLGLVVFLWSRQLFGTAGGLVSLGLFAFCPTMLANGPLLKSDIAAALFFTAAVGGLWWLLQRVCLSRLALSCLALAGLFLAKLSVALIVPMALALVGVRLLVRRPLVIAVGQPWEVRSRSGRAAVIGVLAVLHAAVVWTAVWAAFGFRFSAFSPAAGSAPPDSESELEGRMSVLGGAAPVLRMLHSKRLLPEAYIYGVAFQADMIRTGRAAFLNGEYRAQGGFGWFFPYSWLVKTPLPFFGVLFLAGWAQVRAWRSAREHTAVSSALSLYDLTPLMILLLGHWVATVVARINIGHRYLVPVYPPTFILAGAAGLWFSTAAGRGRRVGVILLLFVAAFVVESLTTWPHYLAYFNVFAGGPSHGYRHLVDSSLDWGQDLPELRKWLEDHGLPSRDKPVYLAYFGSASVQYYGISAYPLPCVLAQSWPTGPPPTRPGGVYCISATLLQGFPPSFPGPWTPSYEATYQKLLRLMRDNNRSGEARDGLLEKVSPEQWAEIRRLVRDGGFARLCASLRAREPDHQVGYSILIYDLRESEVLKGLYGQMP
jgi:hypothetical protein